MWWQTSSAEFIWLFQVSDYLLESSIYIICRSRNRVFCDTDNRGFGNTWVVSTTLVFLLASEPPLLAKYEPCRWAHGDYEWLVKDRCLGRVRAIPGCLFHVHDKPDYEITYKLSVENIYKSIKTNAACANMHRLFINITLYKYKPN